jgi:hypothetical protein
MGSQDSNLSWNWSEDQLGSAGGSRSASSVCSRLALRAVRGPRLRNRLANRLGAGRIVSLFLLQPLFLLGGKEGRKQTPETAACRAQLRALFP